MDAINIRPYTDSDHGAVIALWSEVWGETLPHNEPATVIREKLAVQRELFFVGILDDKLVGTVMGGYDGHRGWVYALVVAPDLRRRGIGTALMHQLEAALADKGCVKINLQVRSSNAEVVAFYQNLGYGIEERISMGKLLPSRTSGRIA